MKISISKICRCPKFRGKLFLMIVDYNYENNNNKQTKTSLATSVYKIIDYSDNYIFLQHDLLWHSENLAFFH